MNKMHVSVYGDTIIFTDEGIITHYQLENKSKRRFFPYGCIQSIETVKKLLGSVFKVVAKDLDPNGNPYMIVMPIHKYDVSELKKSISFAKEKMVTAPDDTMFESSSKDIPKSEEKFIFQAAIKCGENRERNRVKYRNIGLLILLASIVAVLFACFGPGGKAMGFLATAAIFFGFVGFFMLVRHLEPPATIRVPKSSSRTKEIVKGAIVGGIIAGEVGAVVGATIAKNKLDNSK